MKELWQSKNFLGFLFMLPAAAFLLLFLVYPLGLGIWLSFTDAKIGTPGEFVGLENYEWLLGDTKFLTATFFTIFYTVVASIIQVSSSRYSTRFGNWWRWPALTVASTFHTRWVS